MKKDLKQNRAWIEINLDNLENNIKQIKNIISSQTKIMAVVKANAYGHGMIEISKKLNQIGIYDFAVATLDEGITLREAGIKGNILILGYTNFNNIDYLLKYNLIQTIVDYEYAKRINQMDLKEKLKVHIKINTGMNRIGESYKNIDRLIDIYQMQNLEILGTYSHLCVSDSLKENDKLFTNKQITNFFETVKRLQNLGYDTGKIHIQASYGILNYPELNCDYVRSGIIMYGVYSDESENTKTEINLKPVLSLKSRITSIKEITQGESVSYGRIFKADKTMKIATVGIGYADGYPRNLSGKNAKVLVNENYVNIIGRICMDQLVIDVTNLSKIEDGDIVTLIGEERQIKAEEVAQKAGTITNELLSRLGKRLPIIIC